MLLLSVLRLLKYLWSRVNFFIFRLVVFSDDPGDAVRSPLRQEKIFSPRVLLRGVNYGRHHYLQPLKSAQTGMNVHVVWFGKHKHTHTRARAGACVRVLPECFASAIREKLPVT